jgi:ABC-2 type transport system ATP-binding protein
MNAVEVEKLTYRYGSRTVLRDLDLAVPEGALYALVGPNGCGKTTLLQTVLGLHRLQRGTVTLLGTPRANLSIAEQSAIGYVAEGQQLPRWMTLAQVESYLAPLYPTWDASLAAQLRNRLGLDGRRRIRTLSRGEYMKAALLCALAPRPRLLFMDEPFTGMDALVKDEITRGLLESSGSEGWTVVLCSHDIGELEALADTVGFLGDGRMQLSEPMDSVRDRFKRVEVVLRDASPLASGAIDAGWLDVERSGQRLTFMAQQAHDDFVSRIVRPRFPDAVRIDVLDVSLREVFVALAKHHAGTAGQVAA